MLRLIITIVIVLYVAIQIAIAIGNEVEMVMFYNAGEPFYASQYKGTFDLLDEAISEKEEANVEAAISALKARFKLALRLVPRQELDFPARGWDILEEGNIYLHDLGDSSTLYRISTLPDHLWSVPVVPSSVDERIAAMSGSLSLIKEKLSGKKGHALDVAMEELRKSYDVTLDIVSTNELALTARKFSQLETEQIVVQNPDESGELFLTKLNGDNLVLRFGPIDYPASLENREWLFLLIFASIVLICTVLWMWPLWRDLKRLRKASADIGNGKLDTRVSSNPVSLIKPILDGFNHMASRTENMVESQRELTNAVSHELRTPLARMMFDLQMAKETDNKTDQSRHLDSLEFNVGELNTLIDELLTYARQERVESPLEFETMSLKDMTEWLSSQVARAGRSSDNSLAIILRFETLAFSEDSLQFSPSLMAHALSNTLQNAMRFAKETIVVCFEQEGNEWLLSVEDDGIGIPVFDRERVFEPFSRLDESRHRDSGGFGMGLSIVRNIADWHQGDAGIATGKILGGARVEIRWPVQVEFE